MSEAEATAAWSEARELYAAAARLDPDTLPAEDPRYVALLVAEVRQLREHAALYRAYDCDGTNEERRARTRHAMQLDGG